MFETPAAVQVFFDAPSIIRWVNVPFSQVYARNSWMNEGKIIQSSRSRTELSTITYLYYVTLKLLRSAES